MTGIHCAYAETDGVVLSHIQRIRKGLGKYLSCVSCVSCIVGRFFTAEPLQKPLPSTLISAYEVFFLFSTVDKGIMYKLGTDSYLLLNN